MSEAIDTQALADLLDCCERSEIHCERELRDESAATQWRRRARALRALLNERAGLVASIAWACGYTDFAPRPDGAGAYWWRSELATRAGLTHEELQRTAERES